MKTPKLRIIGIEEGEFQLKATEKDIPIKVQEAYRTTNRLDQKTWSPHHIVIKMQNIQNKERILRAA